MEGVAYVVTSGKGGVGKTTITANLGIALALLGKKVCVIDADIGLRNLDIVLGLEPRVVYDLVDVVDGTCKPHQALIRHKTADKLYLLAASQNQNKEAVSPGQMKDLVERLKAEEHFDYLLIDSPAGIERGFRNAIAGADKALIVTTPNVAAVRDADRVIGLVQASEIYDARLIINRLSPDLVHSGYMLDQDDITGVLAIDLVGVVPEDVLVLDSTNKGEPNALSGNSRDAKAFKRIARRINGEDIPITVAKKFDQGWRARLRRGLGFGRKETRNVRKNT